MDSLLVKSTSVYNIITSCLNFSVSILEITQVKRFIIKKRFDIDSHFETIKKIPPSLQLNPNVS